MWERIRVILRKEFRQSLRDPRMRMILIGPPIAQMIVFGFAVNLDVRVAPIAWMDLDRTPSSRELLAEFRGSPKFEIAAIPATDDDARRLLDGGEVMAVVRVLPGFGGRILKGDTTGVQILVDGANSNTASLVSSYASRAVARFAARALARRERQQRVTATSTAGGAVAFRFAAVDFRTRVWFNTDLKSRNYFVPGVLVNIIALVTVMLTAMSIVREKEIGTMEQLLVTPIRPLELMIGKTLPFAVLGMGQVCVMTAIALGVFQVPFRGNFLLLLGSSALFLMTTLGSGLFISTISRTQQQAVMTFFFLFLPLFLLSGFAFPIHSMPPVVQYLTYLDPIRYFVTIVRGIFLKGAGPGVLWPQLAALAVFGVAIFLASALRFQKRLE